MADIILNKPEAGTQAVFEAARDSRIDLNFPTDQATLERSGNDLIFRFDDGSTVVLRDFYTAYTKDSMPDFVIEGTPIAGEQFFTALNEPDLMPAAGPAANAASADGGRFREYADDALINGVNRLDGLDLSSNRAFFPERDPWGGLRGDDTPNYAPTLSVSARSASSNPACSPAAMNSTRASPPCPAGPPAPTPTAIRFPSASSARTGRR